MCVCMCVRVCMRACVRACVCVPDLRQPDALSQILGHVLQHHRLKLLVSQVTPDTQDQGMAKPAEMVDSIL